MVTIKEILESLSPTKREQLMAAFELGVPQHVSIDENGHYLGVNVSTIQGFQVLQEAGSWALGVIDHEVPLR